VAVSRTTIRRAIGNRTGDLVILSNEGSAHEAEIIDSVHLGDRGNNAPSLMNRIVYFSGGTVANLGHEARSISFDANRRALGFAPAAPAIPAVGDTVELWTIADRAGGITTLHDLINDAIRAAGTAVGSEVYDNSGTTTFRAHSPVIAIPEWMVEVGGVEWVDRLGYSYEIPKTHATVRPGRRTVQIDKRSRYLADGRSVTLWGYSQNATLDTDDATTDVDFEWLVTTVAGAVALAQSWKATDRAAEERRAAFWDTKTVELRRKVGAQRRGWGIRL